MILVDLQRLAHGVELVDEQVRRPEVGRGIGQVRAVAAPDLVIVDDRPAGLGGKFGDVADVVVGHSRAAMQDEQGERTLASVVRRSDLHPGFVTAERHQPGCNCHGDQHEPR